jgi:hypothetical protein
MAELREVRISHRECHFLDAAGGVLEHGVGPGQTSRSNEPDQSQSHFFFEEMLQAGWAQTKLRGQSFHRGWTLDISDDDLSRLRYSGVHHHGTVFGRSGSGRKEQRILCEQASSFRQSSTTLSQQLPLDATQGAWAIAAKGVTTGYREYRSPNAAKSSRPSRNASPAYVRFERSIKPIAAKANPATLPHKAMASISLAQ